MQNLPGRIQFTVQSVSEESLQCDYHYEGGTCGSVNVVYKSGEKALATQIRYTQSKLTFEAKPENDPWMELISFQKKYEDVFPQAPFVPWHSSNIRLNSSISCTCGYEEVRHWEKGLYCRLRDASLQQRPESYPETSEKKSEVFYPLDCRKLCLESDDCVMATYHYVQKECHFHNSHGFSEMSKEVKHTDPEKDWVVFVGSPDAILSKFSKFITENLEMNNKHGMVENMKRLMRKLECFRYMTAKAWDDGEYAKMILGITDTISSIAYQLEENRLPALNGPSVILVLQKGEVPLTSFENTINSLDTRVDLQTVRGEIGSVMEGQVDEVLRQGNFDMQFAIREFRFAEKTLQAIKGRITSVESSVKQSVEKLKPHFQRAMVEKSVKDIADFYLSLLKIGNPFDSISNFKDTFNAIDGAVGKVGEVIQSRNIVDKMKDGLLQLRTMVEKGVKVHTQNEKVLLKVNNFISKYEESKGKGMELSEADVKSFLEGFANYKKPFSGSKMEDVYSKILPGVNKMCDFITENGRDLYRFGDIQELCREIKVQYGNLKDYQGAITSKSKEQFGKGAEVIRNYIKIQANNKLTGILDKLLKSAVSEEARLMTFRTIAKIKLLSLRFFYMLHLKQLCHLAEYMSSAAESEGCLEMKGFTKVLSVPEIFATIMSLLQSVKIQSSIASYCGYIPAKFPGDGEVYPQSTLDLESLVQKGSTSFTLPYDLEWLKLHEWDSLYDIHSEGVRSFVTGIQVFLPYPKLGRFLKCGTSIHTTVQAGATYSIYNEHGQKQTFDAGALGLNYHFETAGSSSCSHGKKIHPNPYKLNCMDPGGDGFLPDLCYLSEGMIPSFQPYETQPPLPSAFSEFELKLNQKSPGCVSFPNAAPIKTYLEDAGGQKRQSVRTLMTKVCMNLVKTERSDHRRRRSPVTYSSNTQQLAHENSKCRICNKGEFHAYLIGKQRFECNDCPAGSYQSSKGRFYCQKCPPGKYQDLTGQTSCQDCPVGSFQSVAGRASCEECPPGKYQDLKGQTSCKDCPQGTTCDVAGL